MTKNQILTLKRGDRVRIISRNRVRYGDIAVVTKIYKNRAKPFIYDETMRSYLAGDIEKVK